MTLRRLNMMWMVACMSIIFFAIHAESQATAALSELDVTRFAIPRWSDTQTAYSSGLMIYRAPTEDSFSMPMEYDLNLWFDIGDSALPVVLVTIDWGDGLVTLDPEGTEIGGSALENSYRHAYDSGLPGGEYTVTLTINNGVEPEFVGTYIIELRHTLCSLTEEGFTNSMANVTLIGTDDIVVDEWFTIEIGGIEFEVSPYDELLFTIDWQDGTTDSNNDASPFSHKYDGSSVSAGEISPTLSVQSGSFQSDIGDDITFITQSHHYLNVSYDCDYNVDCDDQYHLCIDHRCINECYEFEDNIRDTVVGMTEILFGDGLTTSVLVGPVSNHSMFNVVSGFTCGWTEDVPRECFFTESNVENMQRTLFETYSLHHLMEHCCFHLSLEGDSEWEFEGTILTVVTTNCTEDGISVPQKRYSQPITVKIPRTVQTINSFLVEADLHDIEVTREFAVSLSLYKDEFVNLIEDEPILNQSTIYGSVRLEELNVEDENYGFITCHEVHQCSTLSVFNPPVVSDTERGCREAIDSKILESQRCQIVSNDLAADTSGCSKPIAPAVIAGSYQHHFNFSTTAVIFPETTAPVMYVHAICNVNFPERRRALLASEASQSYNMIKPFVIHDPSLSDGETVANLKMAEQPNIHAVEDIHKKHASPHQSPYTFIVGCSFCIIGVFIMVKSISVKRSNKGLL